jgi:hypothetical protein
MLKRRQGQKINTLVELRYVMLPIWCRKTSTSQLNEEGAEQGEEIALLGARSGMPLG